MPLEDERKSTTGGLTVLLNPDGQAIRIWNGSIHLSTAQGFMDEIGVKDATLIKETLPKAIENGHVPSGEVVIIS